mmetsp:Transcript_11774/g.34867  ORF Transcript_11774/g.34867 Transcript_11774/m.34867 type:complete len:240 (-) Transcript_11774:227-946(-)
MACTCCTTSAVRAEERAIADACVDSRARRGVGPYCRSVRHGVHLARPGLEEVLGGKVVAELCGVLASEDCGRFPRTMSATGHMTTLALVFGRSVRVGVSELGQLLVVGKGLPAPRRYDRPHARRPLAERVAEVTLGGRFVPLEAESLPLLVEGKGHGSTLEIEGQHTLWARVAEVALPKLGVRRAHKPVWCVAPVERIRCRPAVEVVGLAGTSSATWIVTSILVVRGREESRLWGFIAI